ncbi:InlB B-repeat-containing protein [Nakamurella sp. A5-74]|uniref:InlB B-repeat-containing protein n=1 Tax=Nakamurella sp. A5-74 TaxID=3158264 RepID=A0AAU8DPS2_9ACTN
MVHGSQAGSASDSSEDRPAAGSRRASVVRRGLAVAGLAVLTALPAAAAAPSVFAAPSSATPASRSAAELYLISYEGNHGAGPAPADQWVEVGAAARISENSFAREGYAFVEWNTRGDGTGTSYLPGATVTPTANVTMYAQWAPRTEVYLVTSATSQVFRAVDPALIGVQVNIYRDAADLDQDGGPTSPGTLEIRDHDVLIRRIAADPYDLTVLPIPSNLPLGRAEFTATFIPKGPARTTITSDPVKFTVARASTVTKVTLRQQSLSAADQKKYQVRSAVSVSVQVVGRGTRTVAPGAVALTVDGKVTTLELVNGRAKTALVPTPAGAMRIAATYRPSVDWWVRSTGWASITVR